MLLAFFDMNGIDANSIKQSCSIERGYVTKYPRSWETHVCQACNIFNINKKSMPEYAKNVETFKGLVVREPWLDMLGLKLPTC